MLFDCPQYRPPTGPPSHNSIIGLFAITVYMKGAGGGMDD